jgi:hypothetical protein
MGDARWGSAGETLYGVWNKQEGKVSPSGELRWAKERRATTRSEQGRQRSREPVELVKKRMSLMATRRRERSSSSAEQSKGRKVSDEDEIDVESRRESLVRAMIKGRTSYTILLADEEICDQENASIWYWIWKSKERGSEVEVGVGKGRGVTR